MNTSWRPPPPIVPETTVLHEFRRNAVHVRAALARLEDTAGPMRMDTGFLDQAERFAGYQRLSGPVRRVLRSTDRIAFPKALTALRHAGGARPEAVRVIDQAWQTLQQELDSTVSLGGGPVPRRRVLVEWLDAITFHNTREFKDSYGHFLERWGRAAEAMAAGLAEDAAQAVLRLDELVASALDEPLHLPPPPPFAPPPERVSWWKRLFGG
jgi:hypothetical protein